MPFERGRQKTGGRPVGKTNRFTGLFREAVEVVYNGLGGHAAFLQWAKDNPTEYYRIASRLIPGEMREESGNSITVIVQRNGDRPGVVNQLDHTPTALPGDSQP
jgi:hypothetical protein